MAFFRENKIFILVTIVFLSYTLVSFAIYKERALNGDINNHILSGEMFGVPLDLKSRGIKPLYFGPNNTGWDGQFYYYMSNDIFAIKDTASHIDSPSYRYQRIGFSLYAAIVAKIFLQDWVSPTTYFISYLFLVLAATWSGAKLFSKVGVSPVLILFWSLSIGTQITLFNALPDAAADAFLILAFSAVYSKKYALSVIPFALSALSREAYTLFPSFILLFFLINSITDENRITNRDFKATVFSLFKGQNYYWLVIPGLVVIIWHIYVVWHFGISPSEQAYGVLGYPFVAWKDYFLLGINGNHDLVGQGGMFGYEEPGSLLLFLIILAIVVWISCDILLKRYKLVSPQIRALATASICFVFIYLSFGPTVISNYTGYFKAIAIFFFVIPLLLTATDVKRIKIILIYLLLIIAIVFTTFYNIRMKIQPLYFSDDQYTKMSTVTERPQIECFGEYKARIKVNSIQFINKGILSRLFGLGELIILNVDLTNSGGQPFISSRNLGGVFMSYHWIDEHGKVIVDGIRSAIPGVVLPGQLAQVNVISRLPRNPGQLSLKLSPVQEGCAWFYMANPIVTDEFMFSIKN